MTQITCYSLWLKDLNYKLLALKVSTAIIYYPQKSVPKSKVSRKTKQETVDILFCQRMSGAVFMAETCITLYITVW